MTKEKFAVLEGIRDGGFASPTAPTRTEIECVLKPYLRERGWEVIYIVYIKDVATLVGLKGEENAKELSETISNFYQFLETNREVFDSNVDEELKYVRIHLDKGINVIALLESTEQDGNIFASFVTKKQLDGLSPKMDEIEEKFRSFGKKFQNF